MPDRKLHRLVVRLGGSLAGEAPDVDVLGVSTLADAGPAHVAPYTDGRYREELLTTGALAVLTDARHAPQVVRAGKLAWEHEDPPLALAMLVDLLHPRPRVPQPGFDAELGAWVAAGAVIGEGVELGSGCVVHEGSHLGPGSVVGEHAILDPLARTGEGCRLGAGCHVGPGTVLGHRVVIGEGAVVGSEGFGLRVESGRHVPVRHVGIVLVGDDVSIGARSVVARGTLGATVIGQGTRIDAQVQVGHNVRIGRDCVLAAQVGIAGSSTLGDRVMVGGQAGIADHVKVGADARIGAGSGVIGDVADGATVLGYPAMDRWRYLRMIARLDRRER